MTVLSLCLSVVLAAPIGPISAYERPVPETETEPVFDDRYAPPPTQPKVGATSLLVLGLSVMTAGLVGLMSASGCHTRDVTNRCVDLGKDRAVYPALLVIGFGLSISAGSWQRQL